MKSKVTLISMALAIVFSFNANADNNDFDKFQGASCNEKKRVIEVQLDYAKQQKNINRAEGLQRALENIQGYCSNEKLAVKYQNKVDEKTSDVTKRQKELEKAKAKGDKKKIAKQEAKLTEDQAELKEAQNRLAAFKQEILN